MPDPVRYTLSDITPGRKACIATFFRIRAWLREKETMNVPAESPGFRHSSLPIAWQQSSKDRFRAGRTPAPAASSAATLSPGAIGRAVGEQRRHAVDRQAVRRLLRPGLGLRAVGDFGGFDRRSPFRPRALRAVVLEENRREHAEERAGAGALPERAGVHVRWPERDLEAPARSEDADHVDVVLRDVEPCRGGRLRNRRNLGRKILGRMNIGAVEILARLDIYSSEQGG